MNVSNDDGQTTSAISKHIPPWNFKTDVDKNNMAKEKTTIKTMESLSLACLHTQTEVDLPVI